MFKIIPLNQLGNNKFGIQSIFNSKWLDASTLSDHANVINGNPLTNHDL